MGGSPMFLQKDREDLLMFFAGELAKGVVYGTLTFQEAEDQLQEMKTSLSLLRHPVTRTEGVNEIPMPRLKFRFTDDEVNKLVNLVAVPDGVLKVGEPGKHHNYHAKFAMQCLLLKLSSAGTQEFIAMALGCQPARVSEAAIAMACHIHTKYAERLNDLTRFAPLFAQSAKILREKGAPSMPASGDDDEVPARWPVFCLDGKLFPISRPNLTQDQNSILHHKKFYSGRKKIYALNFQVIALGQGLIVGQYPSPGSANDAGGELSPPSLQTLLADLHSSLQRSQHQREVRGGHGSLERAREATGRGRGDHGLPGRPMLQGLAISLPAHQSVGARTLLPEWL